MESSYLLKLDQSNQEQKEVDSSFIGGQPCIPASIEMPVCELCGAEQTFFFQVAFPEDHVWQGFSMAVFACTSCAYEDYLIPEMLQVALLSANIPEGFLDSYQRNFKIIVFDTNEGTYRKNYKEKIQFKRWNLVSTSGASKGENKIGGQPNWLLDDEAPGMYKTTVPMFFLMQIWEGFTFDIVQDAPPQMIIGLKGNQEPSKHRYYELFLANNLYFFGTKERSEPLVYILTQI
ncbi:hypothetical protein [Lederbergia lenta]|uniref:Uncharacterized protein n=1 Tax=Lederbergia lenta TaxID=1467 RepID=A0A2X4WAJ8_LEDLE|nr:hypothetical protein [Lederbergia lenta]MCM3109743.1 hypothetical protein [Lederbergia lenta]MEC2324506.1 hypothetical protein [Lederbergia lenta]SQI59739.1 Uncharacterised protein [Lederbergia lenta]